MNKSKAIIKVDNAPQKRQNNKEQNNHMKIVAACIGVVLFLGLIILTVYDYLYVAPCITVDGDSYNINDIEVRYNVYNAEAQMEMDALAYVNFGLYSDSSEYWAKQETKDSAKNVARETSIRYQLMYREAVKAGLSLTEEEKTTSKEKATKFYEAMDDSHKKRAKFSLDELIAYSEEMALANKYIDQLKAGYKVTNDTLETPIKVEDYEEMKYQVIAVGTTHSSSSSEEAKPYDASTLKTYKEKMEGYLKEAKAGKELSTLVSKEDSNIYKYMETTILSSDTDYKAVWDALKTLKDGELYDKVIDDGKAYYIVKLVDGKCTETYDRTVKNAIATQEEALLNKDLNKLMTKYNVKVGSGWEDIEIGKVVIYPGDNISEFTVGLDSNEENAQASASPEASAVPEATASADSTKQ